MTPTLALIEQLQEFETALVAEAMTAMGVKNTEQYYTGSDVRQLTPGAELMVGVAITLVADTCTTKKKADTDGMWEFYEMARKSALPVVAVMKSIGSDPRRECMLGDGMAKIFKTSGCCGLVSDGGARDLERINKVGFTVFGSGTVSNHSALIYQLAKEPITVSGVTFTNGALLCGDHDGILVIPPECHAGLVEACILSRDIETRCHCFLRRTDKSPEEKRKYLAKAYEVHLKKCAALLG